MGDIKSFFHTWCNKSKVDHQFECRPTGKFFKTKIFLQIHNSTLTYRVSIYSSLIGPKHRQRFLCELRVTGFNYVAAGNSTVKKDAEKNAARDFVSFLVRNGNVLASDVPGDVVDTSNDAPSIPQLMGANRNSQVFKVQYDLFSIHVQKTNAVNILGRLRSRRPWNGISTVSE